MAHICFISLRNIEELIRLHQTLCSTKVCKQSSVGYAGSYPDQLRRAGMRNYCLIDSKRVLHWCEIQLCASTQAIEKRRKVTIASNHQAVIKMLIVLIHH